MAKTNACTLLAVSTLIALGLVGGHFAKAAEPPPEEAKYESELDWSQDHESEDVAADPSMAAPEQTDEAQMAQEMPTSSPPVTADKSFNDSTKSETAPAPKKMKNEKPAKANKPAKAAKASKKVTPDKKPKHKQSSASKPGKKAEKKSTKSAAKKDKKKSKSAKDKGASASKGKKADKKKTDKKKKSGIKN